MRKHFAAILIINLVVIICVVAGFAITGTPAEVKNLALDNQRINHFMQIKYSADNYYRTNGKLPSTLDSLSDASASTKDPATKKVYEYALVTPTKYKLCAQFSTDSDEIKKKYQNSYRYSYYGNDAGKHKKGYDCIEYGVSDYVLQEKERKIEEVRSEPVLNPLNATFELGSKISLDSGKLSLIISEVSSKLYALIEGEYYYLISLRASITVNDSDPINYVKACADFKKTGTACEYNLGNLRLLGKNEYTPEVTSSAGRAAEMAGVSILTTDKMNIGKISPQTFLQGTINFKVNKDEFDNSAASAVFTLYNFDGSGNQENGIKLKISIK